MVVLSLYIEQMELTAQSYFQEIVMSIINCCFALVPFKILSQVDLLTSKFRKKLDQCQAQSMSFWIIERVQVMSIPNINEI